MADKSTTKVANQVPSLGATISPDGQKVNNQVAQRNASPGKAAISLNYNDSPTQMESLTHIPPCG
jgi:hypothetical protein